MFGAGEVFLSYFQGKKVVKKMLVFVKIKHNVPREKENLKY